MKRFHLRRNSAALSGMILLWSVLVVTAAEACGPFLPDPVFVNTVSPDFSMRVFAGGNVGVVQPTWARSYLVVAYRWLTHHPLDAREQADVVQLWDRRLEAYDSISEESDWLKARGKLKNLPEIFQVRRYTGDFEFADTVKICPDAFAQATATLHFLENKYGIASSAVAGWTQMQDAVFGSTGKNGAAAAPVLRTDDPLLKALREYQDASMDYYWGSLDGAQSAFRQIAQDPKSPKHDAAIYMIARIEVDRAMDLKTTDALSKAIDAIEKLIQSDSLLKSTPDGEGLLSSLKYRLDPGARCDELVGLICNGHDSRLGTDIGDLTIYLSRLLDDTTIPQPMTKVFAGVDTPYEIKQKQLKQVCEILKSKSDKFDLVDWLGVMDALRPNSDQPLKCTALDTAAAHALLRWKQTHAPQWLVASMVLIDPHAKDYADLVSAAGKLSADDPAYITGLFYTVNYLIKQQDNGRASALLDNVLERKNLPPSTRNMLLCERQALSASFDQLLGSCIQCPADYVTLELPDNWAAVQKTNGLNREAPTFTWRFVQDINHNLPLQRWIIMAQDRRISGRLHKQLVAATWTRAQVLGKVTEADALQSELVHCYPALAKLLVDCRKDQPADEKRFAAARLILEAYGMSPFIENGVPRNGTAMMDFDELNANYWCAASEKDRGTLIESRGAAADPAVVRDFLFLRESASQTMYASNEYYPTVSALLTVAERAEAKKQWEALCYNDCPRFLGDAVLNWAASHPGDPRVPEALYEVTKIPRWGQRSKLGSQYSKAAYDLLHRKYPNNTWTNKAQYWY